MRNKLQVSFYVRKTKIESDIVAQIIRYTLRIAKNCCMLSVYSVYKRLLHALHLRK